MARFCAHQSRGTDGFLLDCQAGTLSDLNTRVVVPLLTPDKAPLPAGRLNPRFEIDGVTYVMMTQFIASVPAASLGAVAADLRSDEYLILNALDMLITGV